MSSDSYNQIRLHDDVPIDLPLKREKQRQEDILQYQDCWMRHDWLLRLQLHWLLQPNDDKKQGYEDDDTHGFLQYFLLHLESKQSEASKLRLQQLWLLLRKLLLWPT